MKHLTCKQQIAGMWHYLAYRETALVHKNKLEMRTLTFDVELQAVKILANPVQGVDAPIRCLHNFTDTEL